MPVLLSEFTPALSGLSAAVFHSVLVDAVKSLFGIVGAAVYAIDLLACDSGTSSGALQQRQKQQQQAAFSSPHS